MNTERRTAIKRFFASAIGIMGFGAAASGSSETTVEKEALDVTNFQDLPLFSASTRLGNLLFLSGRGDTLDGDIKVHTDNVIKVLEGELLKAGSSLEKVLKVNVYLNDMKDFQGMNEVYRGRFGKKPPVRTTIACPGGLPPADAYIQMDCIAYI